MAYDRVISIYKENYKEVSYEVNYFGRRIGDEAISAYDGYIKAAFTGIR